MASIVGKKHLSRRDFLRYAGTLGLGVAGTSLLAACTTPAPAPSQAPAGEAGEAGEAAPSAAAKTIQLYTLVWQPGAVEAVQNGVDSWNQANGSRVQVEYIQGSWGNARDYLTTSISGGVTPEIVHGITAWANDYGTQGAYLDLTELLDTSDLQAEIHPKAMDAAVSPLDNKVYGVPFVWEVGMMLINADRFAEQGIALPVEGWTWDEFLPAAKSLTNPPDYYALAANLSATQTTEDIIAWMWQTGAEVMGGSGQTWEIDVEPAREALMLWHDMMWKDEIVSQESFGGSNTLEAFGLGVFSMRQTGCWARRIVIESEPAFTWRMVPLPHYKRHANSSEPQTWSLATDAVERDTVDAAWEVMEWMSNDQNSSAIAYGDWLFPTRQSAMEDPRFTTEELDWNLALAEVEHGIAYPKHPAWAEFDDRVLGPNIQKYLQDELSLDELIDLLETEGTRLLQAYQA